jgi:hypothetical protein
MIGIAKRKISENGHCGLKFIKGDIRKINLRKKFQTVISLFHVMSYQTSNEDIYLTIETAKRHLVQGGIFIFDFWYGPCVLTEKPELRKKKFGNGKTEAVRVSKPEVRLNENIVDVKFDLKIKEKYKRRSDIKIKEVHSMRYLFIPELKMFAERSKMKVVHFEEWLTGKELRINSWSGIMIMRK